MLKRKETILEYESQHPQHVTEHEVIGALALSHSVQEMAGSAGYISDKTMRIALQFQDETERLNRDASFEIAQELFNVRRKMKKLEFYVSQLPPKQAEVIRKHYFEEYSWPALQKELHVSSRTLINRRDEGLNRAGNHVPVHGTGNAVLEKNARTKRVDFHMDSSCQTALA